MAETTEAQIRQRDSEVIARLGRPEQDPLLRAEMDRRWLLGEIDRLRSERYAEALDEVERRIRHQAEAAPFMSMEWRAHYADLAHIEEIRAGA